MTVTGIASTSIPQPTRNISFTFPTPETSQKTWIVYQALISPNATNLTGTEHPFTITVQQDRGDGAGFVAVPDGTTLAVTLSDPTKLTSDTCTTGTTGGTCTVVVDSDDPSSVTVTPGAITVALLDGSGTTVPVTVQPGLTGVRATHERDEDVGGVHGDGVAVGDEPDRCAARVHDHGDAQ